jgi:carbonic anhydrase
MGEAFIFRTIAGHPQPIFEQLIGLDRTSFNFEDVWLFYHTDCGAQYFNEEKIRSGLLEADPSATRDVDCMDFGTMKGTVEESLKEDMAWLKNQPIVRQGLRDAVRGFIWDIKSGELREVKEGV